MNTYVVSLKICFSPVTILVGLYNMVNFGWNVTIFTVLSIFLQEAKPEGYGLGPKQSGACELTRNLLQSVKLKGSSSSLLRALGGCSFG